MEEAPILEIGKDMATNYHSPHPWRFSAPVGGRLANACDVTRMGTLEENSFS